MDEFKTNKGTTLPLLNLRGKPYLQVAHRLVWFREEHPNWTIVTTPIEITTNYSIFRCTISDETGRVISTGHKKEDLKGFADHTEKSETGSIGRALAACGYGTQFAPELDEGDRIVDAPVDRRQTIAERVAGESSGPTIASNHPIGASHSARSSLIRRLQKLSTEKKINPSEMREIINSKFEVESTSQMNDGQLADLITLLEASA